MFKRKNLMVIAMLLVICVLMAACGHAVPSAIIEIDPETGAGTATFTMVVPKNGAPDVGNNFIVPNGDSEPNNTAYITSPEALLNLVQANLPEGFTVSVAEVTKMVETTDEFGDASSVDQGSFDYTITFSFNGIEDFNAKIMQWLPQQYWDAAATVLTFNVAPATMEDGVLTVDMHILDVISQWAFTLISTDTTGAVVDGGSGFDYTYCYNLAKSTLTLKVGTDEITERYDTVAISVTAGKKVTPTEAPTETPTEAPTAEPTPTEAPAADPAPSNPVPAIIISVVAVAVIALGVVLFLKKKKA